MSTNISLIDKIKLFLFVKNLPAQLESAGKGEHHKMLDKIKALLSKLDGLKSTLGLLMVVAYYVGPQFGITVPDVVLKIGTGFASVGLAMKLEKGAGLLSTGINYATKALAVMQAVVTAMAAKQPKA